MISKGGFVAVEHEKIFATEFRYQDPTKICKRGWKPNVNIQNTAVVDFVELTLLLAGGEPHLKIYFRCHEELIESVGLI